MSPDAVLVKTVEANEHFFDAFNVDKGVAGGKAKVFAQVARSSHFTIGQFRYLSPFVVAAKEEHFIFVFDRTYSPKIGVSPAMNDLVIVIRLV